jgi:hypothetical protein
MINNNKQKAKHRRRSQTQKRVTFAGNRKGECASVKVHKVSRQRAQNTRILPDRTESVYVTYPSKLDEQVKRFKFMVFEQVNENGTLRDATSEPKDWTVSSSVAKDLIKWINKNYLFLEVKRDGVGLSSSYDISPISPYIPE